MGAQLQPSRRVIQWMWPGLRISTRGLAFNNDNGVFEEKVVDEPDEDSDEQEADYYDQSFDYECPDCHVRNYYCYCRLLSDRESP